MLYTYMYNLSVSTLLKLSTCALSVLINLQSTTTSNVKIVLNVLELYQNISA